MTSAENGNLDRKDSHLSICLEERVEYPDGDANGFGGYRFDHDALPELDRAEVGTEITLFGKTLAAPLFIGAMTGGTPRASELNRRLALAAEACQVGFALGSQRKLLERPELLDSYAMREVAPRVPLLVGNLGAVQLNYGVKAEDLRRLVRDAGCDAFNFHCNPLQEAIQPEGNTDFSGLLSKLKEVIPELGVPVLIKEVGSGISETTAEKLRALPIAGVETAGCGGTSWSRIESLRSQDPIQRSTGDLFARWGIPTAESVIACRKAMPDRIVIASGGMRNGIEAAKAIALGADAVAFALPVLKAAEKSVDDAVDAIRRLVEELRTVLFLTGCRTVADLRRAVVRKRPDFTARGF